MATHKQIKTARILSENARKSVSAAMREAGYSDRSAEKPQRLTGSKGWQELMAEHLPDETLLSVHKGLLQHPDWRAREAGLENAYKLKGLYKATKVSVASDFDGLTLEELDEKITELQPVVDRYKTFGKSKHQADVSGR